jgi:hypothetical protein
MTDIGLLSFCAHEFLLDERIAGAPEGARTHLQRRDARRRETAGPAPSITRSRLEPRDYLVVRMELLRGRAKRLVRTNRSRMERVETGKGMGRAAGRGPRTGMTCVYTVVIVVVVIIDVGVG